VVHDVNPTSALIGQKPLPTEARLTPGFMCMVCSVQCKVYKCTGVQNIYTAV
jgi:hypothetical protein